MSIPGYTTSMLTAQENAMKAIYASQAAQPQNNKGPNLNNLFNDRMAIMLQQLSQYTDLSSLPLHSANIQDAVKAQKIHQFADTTNAQMDAARMSTDFKIANAYLQIA